MKERFVFRTVGAALLGLALLSFSLRASDAPGSWTKTGSLRDARANHTATLLPDGRVLITGGHGVQTDLASAEIYDPKTGVFTEAAEMRDARTTQTATLLPNGHVLVAGGQARGRVLSSTEIFDPKTGKWSDAGGMTSPRAYATATLLPDGRVLVAGGAGKACPPMFAQGTLPGGALASAEIFNPKTQRWSRAGSMQQPRYCHTASLLKDGRVLVTGGFTQFGRGEITASAEIYDPQKDAWQMASDLPVALVNHAATVLPDGDVLITGGKLSMDSESDAALRYEVRKNAWVGMPNFSVPTNGHAAVLLKDNSILVIGGAADNGAINAVDWLPSEADNWQLVNEMTTPRYLMTATRLQDGRVLVVGGGYATGSPEFVTAEAEVYRSFGNDSGKSQPAPAPTPAPEGNQPETEPPAPHPDRLQDPKMD